MVNEGIPGEELPCYLVECVVYNVPDDRFGHMTYTARHAIRFGECVQRNLGRRNWNNWVEVHGLRYLLRGGHWDRTEVRNRL